MRLSENEFTVDEAFAILEKAPNLFFVAPFPVDNSYLIQREGDETTIYECVGCFMCIVDKETVKDYRFAMGTSTYRICKDQKNFEEILTIVRGKASHIFFTDARSRVTIHDLDITNDKEGAYELKPYEEIYVFNKSIKA